MDSFAFWQTAAALFARHALTAFSTYLLTKYSITVDASTIDLVVGGVSGLAAIVWSIMQKVQPKIDPKK